MIVAHNIIMIDTLRANNNINKNNKNNKNIKY
jgi:hypothetical protein